MKKKGEGGLNRVSRYLSYMYMLPKMTGSPSVAPPPHHHHHFLTNKKRTKKNCVSIKKKNKKIKPNSPLPARKGPERNEGREWEGGGRRGVEHFISLSSLSPSQAFNAPFSACPALCKIMLIPLPVLSHLYKPPFLPLKSNYISLRCCQKTGLACKYEQHKTGPESLNTFG